MVSWKFLDQRIRVTFVCRKLTPGLLAVLLLDEKDDLYNDAKEVFGANVNQEPKVLRLPALQSFKGY